MCFKAFLIHPPTYNISHISSSWSEWATIHLIPQSRNHSWFHHPPASGFLPSFHPTSTHPSIEPILSIPKLYLRSQPMCLTPSSSQHLLLGKHLSLCLHTFSSTTYFSLSSLVKVTSLAQHQIMLCSLSKILRCFPTKLKTKSELFPLTPSLWGT